MKNNLKKLLGFLLILTIFAGCKKTDYQMGNLTAPTNLAITTTVKGQSAANPNGDGSGEVLIAITADNALSYKIDYDANDPVDLVYLPTGTVTKKYTTLGTNTYRVTAVVYGKGGTSSTITKDITVKSLFNPDPTIVASLTGGTSKTWIVDKSVPGQLGVGPWNTGSIRPEWWAAGVNEKVACCNCFYTATFTFVKEANPNTYTLKVGTPDGAFTKGGNLTSLPGIGGAASDEKCFSYGGATSAFSFVPASSGAPATPSSPANSVSTQTSILLAGVSTFIGYGATQKEYEILQITPTYLYLRVQGTETGNAWYLKLKAQ